MFYVVTIEIKGKKREDIKRKSLERHITIYQDMIIGGSFLSALPITTTTTKREKKIILTSQRHLGDILIPATNICNFFCWILFEDNKFQYKRHVNLSVSVVL